MFEDFQQKQFKRDDVTINYQIGGDGPPVLMLHGFPQSLAMWAEVAPQLATNFTVICADLRGYGDSGKPTPLPDCTNYSFTEMAKDNRGLMQSEGFERFHIIGHDRGARTAHRLAKNHPEAVKTLCVMDIAPTYNMFMSTNHHIAKAYWHWYFLAQPAPFPQTFIAHDPDYFYETCLVGWGAAKLEQFDDQQLAEYRRCWRTRSMIDGSCADYCAAATTDIIDDQADHHVKITCPTLNLYGKDGTMAALFDLPSLWQECCEDLTSKALPGGHFFVDTVPDQTAQVLNHFLLPHSREKN